MNTLKVKKLRRDAIVPRRATPGSAGADLSACLTEPFTLEPGSRALLPTGVAVEIEPGWTGLIFGRSGLGTRHGITLSNAVGVIDSDYRGEVMVGLTNHGCEPYSVQPGERVAQLVLVPVSLASVEEVAELSGTARGQDGFGSTGRG